MYSKTLISTAENINQEAYAKHLRRKYLKYFANDLDFFMNASFFGLGLWISSQDSHNLLDFMEDKKFVLMK